MRMSDHELDRLKKFSLLSLEMNKDTKPNVTQQQLTKLSSDIKRLVQQRNLVVMVVDCEK
jgi:hypothetical protein